MGNTQGAMSCLQLGFQMTDITEVLFEGYKTEEFKPIETLLAIRQHGHKQGVF